MAVDEQRPFVGMFIKPYARALLLSTLISIVAAGCALAQPLAMQALLDGFNRAEGTAGLLFVLLAVTVGEAMAIGVQTYVLYRVGASAVARVRTTLVGRILRWPLPRYSVLGRGTITTITTADSARMHTLIAGGIFEIFTSAMLTIGAVTFMMLISPILTAITFSVVFLSVVVVVAATRAVRQDTRIAQEQAASMADELGSTLGAIRTLRASGMIAGREAVINDHVVQSRRATQRVGRRMSWVEPASNLVLQGAFIAVLGFGGVMAHRQEIRLSELMAFLMYLMMTLVPIESGLAALPALQQSLGSWDRIKTLLRDGADSVTSFRKTQTGDYGAPMIELSGVGHTHGDTPLFTDVDAMFEPGSVTALWGPSGAGKSTFMDILSGLAAPTCGTVKISGHSQAASIASSYLEQRAPLLPGSIRENLHLGCPDADDWQMTTVLEEVGLEPLIHRDARGLDTPGGEDGLELSGGESQRLALARILLAPERLILLDEPTARVDRATEELIHRAVSRLRGSHTIVIATHREPTKALCDSVIEFLPQPAQDGAHTKVITTHNQGLAVQAAGCRRKP